MYIDSMQQTIIVSPSFKIPPPSEMDFASMCKAIRNELEYTQDEMARFLRVSKRTYNYWESGEREPTGNVAVWLVEIYQKLKEKNTSNNP